MALASLLGAAAALAGGALAHSTDDYDHMGALGVKRPPDRAWSEDDARTAPCGNVDGVANRTDFPFVGGSMEFEQTNVVYELEVYLSLSEDPETNEDFELVSSGSIPSLDFAHVCLDAPNLQPEHTDQNATLQFRYVAPYHSLERDRWTNETFYLCSDITLVFPTFASRYDVPCFNVSSDEISGHTHDDESHEDENAGQEDGTGEGGGGGLPGGAIAGIVIGSLAIVSLTVNEALGFWLRRAAREEETQRQVAANEKPGGKEVPGGSGQESEGNVYAA